MKSPTKKFIKAVFIVAGMVCVLNAQATLDTQTYSFHNITHNDAADASVGEAQLSVQIFDRGTNRVGFKFSNEGLDGCVITEIYFQGGSILGFSSIDESLPGVEFDEVGSTSPRNLPGGMSIMPQFTATTELSIASLNPGPHWGVGPGEWVEVVYSLQPGKIYADIIQELNHADLRIGIHVQSFAGGGSESFINDVPEPGSMAMLILGGFLLRKHRKYK